MTICLKSQTKEIENGTLRIQKLLEKDSKVPYYLGTFQPKNSIMSRVLVKRWSKFSMNYLESRL